MTRVLLGDAPPEMKSMVANELATETVWAVAKQQSKFWKSVDPIACEPSEGMKLVDGSTSSTPYS